MPGPYDLHHNISRLKKSLAKTAKPEARKKQALKDDPNCERCTEDCAQCAADAGVAREEPMKTTKPEAIREVSDGLANRIEKNARNALQEFDRKAKERLMKTTKPEMRSFEGGATRNTDDGKLDIEGFLSPFALKAYCEYLDSHRVQADGKLRDSDNWQTGFGPGVCMKSLLRHTWDAWMIHRGGSVYQDGKIISKKEALCAAAFNIFSQLHDMEKPQEEEPLDEEMAFQVTPAEEKRIIADSGHASDCRCTQCRKSRCRKIKKEEPDAKPKPAKKQNWAKCRSLGKRLCESCCFDALDGCSLKVCSYRVRTPS